MEKNLIPKKTHMYTKPNRLFIKDIYLVAMAYVEQSLGIVYKLVHTDGAKLILFEKVTCPVGQ